MAKNTYSVPSLTFDWKANNRLADLSRFEQKRGYRVIGGDHGDVRIDGYIVTDEGTTLLDVRLVTNLERLTEEEASEIARGVVDEAYASIGVECVEHS